MTLELTTKEFRRLLDMIYIGNWVLNSARGNDRITDYDAVESKVFSECLRHDMTALAEQAGPDIVPSRAFAEGGIHEAIMDYEDVIFFEILAEELARRDMQQEGMGAGDSAELNRRMAEYMAEFELNGIENIHVDA